LAGGDIGRAVALLSQIARMTFSCLGIPVGTHAGRPELEFGLDQASKSPCPALLEFAPSDRHDVTNGRQTAVLPGPPQFLEGLPECYARDVGERLGIELKRVDIWQVEPVPIGEGLEEGNHLGRIGEGKLGTRSGGKRRQRGDCRFQVRHIRQEHRWFVDPGFDPAQRGRQHRFALQGHLRRGKLRRQYGVDPRTGGRHHDHVGHR
jgi:hypothetical protein